MSGHGDGFHRLEFTRIPAEDSVERARSFTDMMRTRRSVRHFSSDPVPFEVIAQAIATAGTAPSGANQQPWRFVVVRDADVKRRIREAAEAEERESYAHRMSQEWLDALAPLGTSWQKPYLEIVPVIIVCFRLDYGLEIAEDGVERRVKHYYPSESMGISVGMLITALHNAGLATLTHTPSPMGFLNEVLGRPRNERPFVVLPVGYPVDDCEVPVITKKPLDEIMLVV
ncbi:MAG TPA: nitroreductase family protein [Thermomicrobiales bacterium]|nr:nitroreductase family protein [Thermomicrobiales bacterium]